MSVSIAEIRQELEAEEAKLWAELMAVEKSPEYIAAQNAMLSARSRWCDVRRKIDAIKAFHQLS